MGTTKSVSASVTQRERGPLQATLQLCFLVAVEHQEKLSFHDKKGLKKPLFAGFLWEIMITATQSGHSVHGSYWARVVRVLISGFTNPLVTSLPAWQREAAMWGGGIFSIL